MLHEDDNVRVKILKSQLYMIFSSNLSMFHCEVSSELTFENSTCRPLIAPTTGKISQQSAE